MRVPILDDLLDWMYGVEVMERIRNGIPYTEQGEAKKDGS